ncbi:T9SS type B sorting domain-containing protein [Neolewinella aurantiaca]|nr:gliding motility-associated C-terminal domain-containing protein [Neolewinella aurantiaca]
MPCDPSIGLSITCEGETPSSGDNNPGNGAFMTWTANGANLYYSRIYSGTDTFEISRASFSHLPVQSVFSPNQPDGTSYEAYILVGDNVFNECVPPGIYTVQVWSVQDFDGDLQPDTDFDGNIIGCYEECTYDFRPSCAPPNIPYFTVDARDIGCNGSGGSVRLHSFRTESFYCVAEDGTGTTINWTGPNGFTATGPMISGLTPGIYSAEIMDLYGCTAYWDANITQLDNVAFACSDFTAPTTIGGSDGTINIDILAGLGDYNLSWTGPVSGNLNNINDGVTTLTGLPAGTYVFTVFDLESMCTEDCTLIIPQPDCSDLAAEILEVINSDCDGNLNGGITLTFSGDHNPMLVWEGPGVDGSTEPELTGLGPGTYTYTVTDSRLCEVSGSVNIISEPSFTFNCGGVDETLPFLDDGKIGLELSGGTPDFLLSYVAVDQAGDSLPAVNDLIVASGDTIYDLPSGTYFFEITDQTGCSRTCVATIGEANCDIFPNCTPTNPVSIFGDGQVTLNFDSGPDWFVTISGPLDSMFVTTVPTVEITGLLAGDYTVSTYNTEGCTGSCVFSIVPPPCTLAATVDFDPPGCNDENNGSIRLDITGASPGLVVDWDVDAYDGRWVVNDLPAGTYRIHVSDRTDCPLDTIVVVLDNPEPFGVDLTLTEQINCFGDSTGGLAAIVSGGAYPLTYNWSVDSLPNDSLVGGLIAGNYSLEVTDANGCVANNNFVITQPPQLTLSCSATAETLASIMDGTVSVANAGTGNVMQLSGDLGDFVISANSDTTINGLGPGTYNLILTDQNGCTTQCTAIVNPGPCMIGLLTTSTQPDCGNARGAATATPVNPFGVVTYRWSNGDTTASIGMLAPGSYTVTIVDESGCEATDGVNITPFTDIPSLSTTGLSPACEDDCVSLQLNLAGTPPFAIDYVFSQNGGPEQEMTINRNSSGSEMICAAELGLTDLNDVVIRILDITDGNGCSRPVGRTLPVVLLPPAVGQLDTVLCPETPLNLFGEVFDENRLSDIISLPFPSAGGCDSFLMVNISYAAPAVSYLDTTLCIGNQLRLFGQVFNANRLTGEVLTPMPSAAGCDSTINVSIQFYAPAFSALDTTLCPGQRLNFFGQFFHENRTSGPVVVPTPSANGCDSTVMVNVSFREPALGTLDTTICRYSRLNYYGQFFDVNRPQGTVRLPISSSSGCDTTVMVNLSFPPEVIGFLDTTICTGDTLVYGDVTFVRPATSVLTQLDIADQYGCDSLVFVTVRNYAVPTVRLSGDGIVCPGGSPNLVLSYDGSGIATVVLSSDPTDTISLLNGSITINRQIPVGTQVSILAVAGGDGCQVGSQGTVQIRETDLAANIEILSGDDAYAVSCAGGSDGAIIAIPNGGQRPYIYSWDNGSSSAVLQNLPAGDYSVSVTSRRGCTAEAEVTLVAPESLETQVSRVEANCVDTLPYLVLQEVQGGVGPYLFRTSADQNYRPLPDLPDSLQLPVGASVLQIEDMNGCLLSERFDFEAPPRGELIVSPRRAIIAEGDSVRLQLLTNLNGTGYLLSPGPDSLFQSDNFFVSPGKNTTYEITTMDEFGCTATAMVEIIVDDYVPIYAPNVFSPNGDGVNDLFRIYARSTVLSFSDFAIFSRWGEMVYFMEESVTPNDGNWGWDGHHPDGNVYEQDVYIFKVIVELSGGRKVEITGDVLLMR